MRLPLAALCAALLIPPVHATELALGPSIRAGSYAIGLRGDGALAPEIQFISEGRQPDHFPNINRVLMFNGVATADLRPRLQGFVKAGIASSRWSTNGSGDGYRNPGRFGWDAGAGLTWWPTQRWGLRVEILRMRYEQSDVPGFETFTQSTLQAVFRMP
jgi:opacity protein-like surface antigen